MTLIKPIKEVTGATLRLAAMIVRNRWIFDDVAKEGLYCQAALEAKEEHDALVKRIRELEGDSHFWQRCYKEDYGVLISLINKLQQKIGETKQKP